MADFLTLDNILAIVLVYYVSLQHKRATERDKNFHATMQSSMSLLKDCGEVLGKISQDKNES